MSGTICQQTVTLLDLGDKAPPMERFKVEVWLEGNQGIAPRLLFRSRFTDALEATAIWRDHTSRHVEFDEKYWGEVRFPKGA